MGVGGLHFLAKTRHDFGSLRAQIRQRLFFDPRLHIRGDIELELHLLLHREPLGQDMSIGILNVRCIKDKFCPDGTHA